ncbi:ATP-grasp fold amidoligase family protein [Lederbergia ruris]|uniref:ATP-grasp fold amidoligase family protein n=1 Tax=Lederbergia ruris TaxID=217495 RepID=UPI0039A2549B
MSKLRDLLRNSELIVNLYDNSKLAYYKYMISDEDLIAKKFKERLGREVDFSNPVKFNDKLQWLKLNWHDTLAIKCADKYEVRWFVKERIGEEYLNEIYGVYESVDEINIDRLPNSFVLKGTHGSGYNIICKIKTEIHWGKEFKKMRRWLRENYYWQNREWVYKDIKPRIICERYLEEPGMGQLRDYKIFCFNGVPKLIEVDFDRFDKHKRNLYDLDWNLIDAEIRHPKDRHMNITRPKRLSEMLELAGILSKDFPHVRVDFYVVEDKIYFGELTFFHGSGMEKFNPIEFEIEMGNWLQLPKK